MTDLRGHIAEAAAAKGLSIGTLERYADEIGVPKDGRADEAQLAQILARIYSPGSGVPTASPAPTPTSGTSAESAGEVVARAASPIPSDEELLEAAGPGATMVDAGLQERIERAKAKGKAKEPEQASLAEALGSPVEPS
jgi:hypothetical protein